MISRRDYNNKPIEIPPQISKLSKRETDCLWHYINDLSNEYCYSRAIKNLPKNSIDCINIEFNQKQIMLAKIFRESPYKIERSIKTIKDRLLTLDELAIIDKSDVRLLLWLHLELYNLQRREKPSIFWISPTSYVSQPLLYREIIYALDTWNASNSTKINELNKFLNSYKRDLTPLSQVKWIDSNNTDLLEWSWDYIHKKGVDAEAQKPTTQTEYHSAILFSLDRFKGNKYEREKFIRNMKAAWSQKKYRESSDAKKPVSFSLSKKVRDQLDWLSKREDVKPAEMIAKLIQAEYNFKGGK